MKNKILIVIILLILILGGGAFLILNQGKSRPVKEKGANITPHATLNPGTSKKSLKELLTSDLPQKCSYSDITQSANIEGTTYLAGGKMRGDFTTTSGGKNSVGHTIFDGKISYVWTDETKQGFKMEVNPDTLTSENTSNTNNVDLNKTLDYKCGVWITEPSFFDPPKDIEFTEFNFPATTGSETGSGNNSLCATCNTMTGDEKTQCLTALKCN